MTLLAQRLARPEILALPAADFAAATDGAFAPGAIRLHANENPAPPPGGDVGMVGLNRYPEPRPAALTAALASLYGVPPSALVPTRGADDAIDILIRTFCRPGEDAIAILPPTFGAYAQFARVQGARVIEVPLGDDFTFDPTAVVAKVREHRAIKLIFLCSPNNPTGAILPASDVLAVANALSDAIVVLDEAYIEFSDAPSLAAEAARRPNLVVLRTLSKAFGLAGARVGAAIGDPNLLALAARALPPYPLPSPSVDVALAALAPARRPLHDQQVARLVAARDRLAPMLSAAPGVRSVRNGGGNFLFLEVDDPEALAATLANRGIRVRFRPQAAPGGVRVSIGNDAENEALLAAFGVETSELAPRRAEVARDTRETAIAVAVDLDAAAPRRIDTGVPFYDHMLDQVAAHGGFALTLSCVGDLAIDAHHSIEDCAIALGQALSRALGDRRGIGRFGFALPMDEAEAQVLIDLSGRPYAVFEGTFAGSHVGDYPTEMTRHVFRSLADTMGAAIHVRVRGDNDHHKTEACFKAFGRALRQAIRHEGDPAAVPSTKGLL